jgi:hypothetical protein
MSSSRISCLAVGSFRSGIIVEHPAREITEKIKTSRANINRTTAFS